MKSIFSEENTIWIVPFFIVSLAFVIPISVSLKSIFSVVILVAVLMTPYYRKNVIATFNTLWVRAALALILFVVIACLWSQAPILMRTSVTEKYSKLLYLPIFAVGFINPKTRRWTFHAYFAAILITCVVSFLKQKGLVAINNMEDSGEVFHNHIATGFMVSLAVYFAGILSFSAQIKKWERVYYSLVMIIGSYQVFFLNTGRTGYVTYTVLMTLLLVQKLPLKKAILGFLLLCSSISVVYMASPLMQIRTAALISDIKFLQQHEENTSLGFRVQFHDYARSLFERHPLIGVGTGSFKYLFRLDQPVPSWTEKLHDPHSQYWLTLSEQGLIGLAFYLMFLASLFVMAFKLSSETKPIVLGLLIVFSLGSITDSILCYSTAGLLLVLFSALGFGELIEKRAYARVVVSETHHLKI
ncbi:MAG: O-antigen ligase family protein [Legionella sp.]|uniref:O-antigen ligase family protein n=1 Tax=Legionella sp. TaxID=459 RepID=UPI0039E3CDE2